MIAQIQHNRVLNRVLKKIYERGRTASLAELKAALMRAFAGKTAGLPLFHPRMVANTQVIDPEVLTNNLTEIKEDIDNLHDAFNEFLETEAITFGATTGEALRLKHRAMKLKEDLDSILLMESSAGQDILFDNFRDNTKVNLEKTTAFINTAGGFATLPLAPNRTVYYTPNNIKVIKEVTSPKVKLLADNFLNVFTPCGNELWQAVIPENESYLIEINLTGKEVIPGHSNEVELNRIFIEPVGTISIRIDSSVDGFNWKRLIGENIQTGTYFNIEPTWALFLRFTVEGTGHVGIRQIELGKTGTSSTATLYSKALTANTSIYNLIFKTNEELPHGTEINHYISTEENGTWSRITPGKITLLDTIEKSVVFSDALTAEVSTGLYKYTTPDAAAILESGILRRGISQCKVTAMPFDWQPKGDKYHIPEIEDFQKNLGNQLHTYMSVYESLSGTTIAPSGVRSTAKSFIITYSNEEQSWWGVPIISATGTILNKNYNYKISTYLYSDRDVIIDNAGGGIYALTGTFTGIKGAGWSLYINDRRIAYDNAIYSVLAIPGSGTLTTATGKSFPLALKAGWNKIDLLVYMPDNTVLTANVTDYPMALLLRPCIFDFNLPDQYNWSYVPKQQEYPIWADGAPMPRVSEFFLRWNTRPLDNDFWAWRVSMATGTPEAVLVNYNAKSGTNTIDGIYKGSDTIFQLKYKTDYKPTNTIYYKAELKKTVDTAQTPLLRGYSFTVATNI